MQGGGALWGKDGGGEQRETGERRKTVSRSLDQYNMGGLCAVSAVVDDEEEDGDSEGGRMHGLLWAGWMASRSRIGPNARLPYTA